MIIWKLCGGNILSDDSSKVSFFNLIIWKEKELQKSLIEIKKKYGKNAVIKGMDLESKATTIKRNELVGGHNAGGSRREDYKDGEKK